MSVSRRQATVLLALATCVAVVWGLVAATAASAATTRYEPETLPSGTTAVDLNAAFGDGTHYVEATTDRAATSSGSFSNGWERTSGNTSIPGASTLTIRVFPAADEIVTLRVYGRGSASYCATVDWTFEGGSQSGTATWYNATTVYQQVHITTAAWQAPSSPDPGGYDLTWTRPGSCGRVTHDFFEIDRTAGTPPTTTTTAPPTTTTTVPPTTTTTEPPTTTTTEPLPMTTVCLPRDDGGPCEPLDGDLGLAVAMVGGVVLGGALGRLVHPPERWLT